MPPKPPPPGKPPHEWDVSMMYEWDFSKRRNKLRYLGRVIATDREGAIDEAMEEFRIEPAHRLLVIVEPVE